MIQHGPYPFGGFTEQSPTLARSAHIVGLG